MQVNPDKHAEYQRRHSPIWPELEQVLKEHGAHHYSIFLDEARHLLFGYVEIESRRTLGCSGQHRRLPALVAAYGRRDAEQS